MIVIIEGPDGSGKTTLAKHFEEQGFEILHFSHPDPDEDPKSMFSMYESAIKFAKDKNVVLDRSWYSEMVYGPILRDKSCISEEDMYALETMAKGALVIHCSAPLEKLWGNCQRRGEDFITQIKVLEEVMYSYNALFKTRVHELLVVSYTIPE